eukprot:g2926.t1
MTTGALDITILNAEKLKSQALFGKQRPYVVCQVGVQKERSKASSGKCPKWNETLRFFITHERTLFITIKRRNKIVSDNVIGNVEVNLEKVKTFDFECKIGGCFDRYCQKVNIT